MSSIWGAITNGIFAVPTINEASGLLYGNLRQITVQIIAVIATIIHAFVLTFVIVKIIDKTMVLE